MNFSRVSQLITNIIAPPFCFNCHVFLSIESVLCDVCDHRIKPIVSKTLNLYAKKTMPVYAIGHYEDPLKKIILAKSWSYKLASTYLARLMWDKSVVSHLEVDYIVPIPLHWTRYAWRGYNQAEVIARTLSTLSGKPYSNILKRTRYTPFQSALPLAAREDNVKQVFSATHAVDSIMNKRILLVDDLMTTGATLKAAADVLLPYRPKDIAALVACRI